VPEKGAESGRTVVLGERELAIGFRLIGLKDVVETTTQTAQADFTKLFQSGDVSLIVASQSVRSSLSEKQRFQADGSIRPLVVFVPPPSGTYEIESIADLAKRVLGVSLAVPAS
jgi:vacuolar-type H+-ATPase subunit F/Vma7